ncbi:KRAB [Acanthosepion pharaonis]|uniref:KRAB n=1 Tax=Acanthosepion pharaonis TaxID=158019 RepID=A0A812E666_ACAPH|nr:KRAB [Sepia pharaonis]
MQFSQQSNHGLQLQVGEQVFPETISQYHHHKQNLPQNHHRHNLRGHSKQFDANSNNYASTNSRNNSKLKHPVLPPSSSPGSSTATPQGVLSQAHMSSSSTQKSAHMHNNGDGPAKNSPSRLSQPTLSINTDSNLNINADLLNASPLNSKQFYVRKNVHDQNQANIRKKPFRCPICGNPFLRRRTMEVHEKTHSGIRPFSCSYCPQRFFQKDKLLIHERTHTGERPFECNICSKQFARKDTLNIHRRMHSGERPYPCEHCHKRFAQRDKLLIHERTHSGEKPYQCLICSKQFARKDTLNVHHRTHTGEQPYRCDNCGKRFSQRDKLALHKWKCNNNS